MLIVLQIIALINILHQGFILKDEIMLIIFMSTLISNWMNTRDRKAAFIRNMNYGSHIK